MERESLIEGMSWRIMSSPRCGWRGLERLVFQAVRLREKQTSAVLLTEKDLQQLAKSQNGPLLTDIIDTFRTWCSKPPPKGFEKFFKDKPGAKKAAGEAEAAGESRAAKPKAAPRARVDPPKRKVEAKAENDLSELLKVLQRQTGSQKSSRRSRGSRGIKGCQTQGSSKGKGGPSQEESGGQGRE